MSYSIIENLLTNNRPKQSLSPQGVVFHETATLNATAKNIRDYFQNNPNTQASSHYSTDYTSIIMQIPENEIAWHAGYTANHKFLSIEMCHFDDPNLFKETYNRTIWLIADMCKRYNWNPDNDVHSHDWVSKTYGETNHTDPISYLLAHGISWNQVIQDVKNAMIIQPQFSIYVDNILKGEKNTPQEAKNFSNALLSQVFGGQTIEIIRVSDKVVVDKIVKPFAFYIYLDNQKVGEKDNPTEAKNISNQILIQAKDGQIVKVIRTSDGVVVDEVKKNIPKPVEQPKPIEIIKPTEELKPIEVAKPINKNPVEEIKLIQEELDKPITKGEFINFLKAMIEAVRKFFNI